MSRSPVNSDVMVDVDPCSSGTTPTKVNVHSMRPNVNVSSICSDTEAVTVLSESPLNFTSASTMLKPSVSKLSTRSDCEKPVSESVYENVNIKSSIGGTPQSHGMKSKCVRRRRIII